MARKLRTETFDLLCGYIEASTADNPEDQLHTTCTIKELDHATDKNLADRSIDFLSVISRHVVAVGDIIDRDTLDKDVIPNLMKGDLDYILLKLRILSVGEEYTFSTRCGNKDCSHVTEQTLDLTTLDVVDMPDPLVREVVYVTEDKACTLRFRPYLAQDLLAISDIISAGKNELALLLGLRLVELNGETPESNARARGRSCKTPEQRAALAAKMLEDAQISHRERGEIRKKLDDIAGYPKLVFQAKCGSCGALWNARVEITPTFLVSSTSGS